MSLDGVQQKILDGASRLFLHYGYKRTTVDMIASAVGIAKGSVYLHFKSKDEIFAAAIRRLCRQVLDGIAATASSDMPVEAKLHKLCLESSLYVWDFCHQAPHAPALWLEILAAADQYAVSAYKEARTIVARVIAEGQSQGVFSRDLDADAMAGLLQIALQGFDLPYLLIDSRQQIETQLPQMLSLFLHGLKTYSNTPNTPG